MKIKGLTEKPDVIFSRINSEWMTCKTGSGHNYSLDADGKRTVKTILRNLFSQIMADAANDQWMESAYAQAINDANLNELELSVLQYICRNGYTWENDIKKFLIKNFPTSSSADEMCLDKLCNLVIRDTDPVETAVSFCYKKIRIMAMAHAVSIPLLLNFPFQSLTNFMHVSSMLMTCRISKKSNRKDCVGNGALMTRLLMRN